MAIDHFEALFDKKYLRWFHLNDYPALVRITKVTANVEMVLPGGAACRKPVVNLEMIDGRIADIKPLVLNSTNAESIAKIHGTKPSQWVGQEVVLFGTITKFGNEDKNCIRIRAKKGGNAND